jgi:two-component system phosphate regulon sensor histidine kinase PhoR
VRRDFVANVSHELRTPITSIKGFVETLQDGAAEDPQLRTKFLDIIARHADRLNAIFNDLLTLARLESESEGAAIELSPVIIRDVLHGAVEICSSQASQKGVNLRVAEGERLLVEGNASLLEQAVVNLVDNATKFTDSGGSITLSAEAEGENVKVSVADTGCGIEKAHLSRLFERFYRIDHGRSRKLGGTGLGLAIVKHIAQVHAGRVEVTSTPGRGSTFTLYLKSLPKA